MYVFVFDSDVLGATEVSLRELWLVMVAGSTTADFSESSGILSSQLVEHFTVTLLGEDLACLVLAKLLVGGVVEFACFTTDVTQF